MDNQIRPHVAIETWKKRYLTEERGVAGNLSRNALSQYKPMVENIFGYDSLVSSEYIPSSETRLNPNGGWMLKSLTRSLSQIDYDAVIAFLHPDSPDGIFALIKSLMAETSAKFEFPVSQFPPCFRTMIENGTAPPYFANKIISTSYLSASHLILNPFEYYIFHFGLYILNSSGSNFDISNSLNNEPAYFTLLKIYLNQFVPLENSPVTTDDSNFAHPQSTLWQSLSSTTSSILNLASNNQTANTMNTQNGQMVPSLFKATIFQPRSTFNHNFRSSYMTTPGPLLYGQGEHLGSLEWRCSTFLLMLTELWFGNIPAPKTNYILRSTSFDDHSVPYIQPYSANIDQMTSVRIVIKHLHSFSNSFTYSQLSPANNQALAEIKQTVWTAKYPLQKRLYTFIKVAFDRWPMDYTFRQPLEAWLSYIQPWRYVKANNDLNNDYEDLDGNKNNNSLIDAPSIDNHWRNFISDNLPYYSVIFGLLIDRLLQLDLSSSRNALMLFRAIKVYSQPGFLSLLREAEVALFRNNLELSMNMNTTKSSYKFSTPGKGIDPNSSKAKLLAPSFLASGKVSTPKTRMGALEHHLMNLDCESDNHYVSLFSEQAKQNLAKLMIEVQKSRLSIKEFVQAVEARSKLRSKGWIDSVLAFLSFDDACFESKDEREMYKDKIQAENYLNFATNKIAQCFGLSVPDVKPHTTSSTSNLTNSQSSKIFFNF